MTRDMHGRTGATRCAGEELVLSGPDELVMRFVWCPPGEFTMGDDALGGSAPKKGASKHRVTLTRGFWLARFVVTQDQYAKANGCWRGHLRLQESIGPISARVTDRVAKWVKAPEVPQTDVSWEESRRLGKTLRGLFPGYELRLPTEAEWEYACRAGSETAYCFGDDPGELCEYAWFAGNYAEGPNPVGLKRPNAWGLYDMHGNVQEFCEDGYMDYGEGTRIDPVGSHGTSFRVVRGGNWWSPAEACASGHRCMQRPYKKWPSQHEGIRFAAVEAVSEQSDGA